MHVEWLLYLKDFMRFELWFGKELDEEISVTHLQL